MWSRKLRSEEKHFFNQFHLTASNTPLSEKIYITCGECPFFSPSFHQVMTERLFTPAKRVFYSCWWRAGAVDLLHALCDARASSIIDLLCCPPSDQLMRPPPPPTPSSASATLASPNQRRKATAEMHIESVRCLTSWISESRLKRMQRPHRPRLVSPRCSYGRRGGRAEVDNAVTNCVFLFSSPLIPPLSSPHRCPLPAFHLHSQPFRHSVSHPLGVRGPLIRKVNWLCCVFRRLHNDDGTGGIEGDNFLNFLRTSTCSPSAIST